jgi:hypothetical protein
MAWRWHVSFARRIALWYSYGRFRSRLPLLLQAAASVLPDDERKQSHLHRVTY